MHRVALTVYVCAGAPPGYDDGYCGAMASGATVYEGAVACGDFFALGTRLTIEGDPTGREYVCEDRGLGPSMWVDVFYQDFARGHEWRRQLPKTVLVRVVE